MTFATTEMYIHGHVGFPDTATERRTRIVNRKKRQRKRCDEKIGFAADITSASILPNSSRNSDTRHATISTVSAKGTTAEIIKSCPDVRDASSSLLLPMYWLMTAPPVVSTVNRKMRTVLNIVTSDTPETSASLEKLTVKVSAIPTNIRRNCSTKSDRMSPPKSLLLNNSDFIFFHKGVLAVGKQNIRLTFSLFQSQKSVAIIEAIPCACIHN